MRRLVKIFIAICVLGVGFGFSYHVLAAGSLPSSTIELENPLKTESIFDLMANVINTALGLMGAAALVVFVYGGTMWLIAAGNQERVKKGSQAMIWAVVGIFIILGSYVILNLVFEGFGIKEDVPQNYTWCLMPENQCIRGSGGACPGGTAYANEYQCTQDIKQCWCHDAYEVAGYENWVARVDLTTERACNDYAQQSRPPIMDGTTIVEDKVICKWETNTNMHQSQ